ncbi:phospho-acceptor domain-containing protein [Actinomadura pelletieri DSM 43383]|uniref:histidine kinase n=1 Tax=Actinomadura pelletieri DSM 43383 TaxID=1120940 RepID=A0A495R0U0_9ACTN|nr:ATP-binding protein [Actinomadura pelletieri]RKS79726.1 phospho-acceptor domain-containing protein [Actinomadura pelletieri DSM 43383]
MTGDDPRAPGAAELDRGPAIVLPEADVPVARGMSRLRLVQIYRIGSIVLGLLLMVAFAHTAFAQHEHTKARAVLIDRVDPAALEQYRLSSAINRQDTAIRDYALDGGRAPVADYREAVAREAMAAARIRRLLHGLSGGGDVLRRLDDVVADSRAWRAEFADRVAAGPGGEGFQPEQTRRARYLLNQARDAMTMLQADTTRLHDRASSTLRARSTTAIWSTRAALGLVVLAALGLALLIRRTVLTPVSSLTGRVRAVAQGDLGHSLDVGGPSEINELAVIIDAMRERIIDEWRATVEQTRLLDAQTEELRRSNAELEQFAYVASHDLQEPLRKVASFCQLIEHRYGDQLDERGRQYIDFAVDGAKRMQILINDLLNFSRVGRETDFTDSVDLNEVADLALDNLAALREETGAEVDVGDLPHLPGDRGLLIRLFQNLLGNAIKFHRPGVPPRVTIEARRTGDEWEFRCADNGIGIEPRHTDRIFLIFQRLHPRDTYTGTGIGLALCKKIVEYHGGRIWLDTGDHDDQGDVPGTTFHWTLPARRPHHGDGDRHD